MKLNKKTIIVIILLTIYAILFFGMAFSSVYILSNNKKITKQSSAKQITKINATYKDKQSVCTLPYKFKNLHPREKLIIKFNINTKKDNYIYVKSVYAPFKVYADNKLVFSYTSSKSQPKFMKDPPTKVSLVQLKSKSEDTKVKIIYEAPMDRSSLMIHPFIHGNYLNIKNALLHDMFLIFIIAIITALFGIFLIVLYFVYKPFESKAISFLWLGIFSMLTGIFSLSECNLSQLYVGNEYLLYILDFCCFFILPIPLIEFSKTMITFKNNKFLNTLQFIQGIAAVIALFLQAFSIIPLYKSLYLFIVLSPTTLLLLALKIIISYIQGNMQCKIFITPILIISISSIIEAINYKFRFLTTLSSCFMIGVLIFIVLISIECGKYIRGLINLKEKNKKLEYDLFLLEKQIQVQEQKNELVMKNVEILKSQRHDLRHQLAVIQHYNNEGQSNEIKEYINTLINAIPAEKSMTYCDNQAINAIIVYYLSLLKNKKTNISIKLSIPSKLNNIYDKDLCIIIGNLLENAVEACNKLDNKTKSFIKLNSRLQYDTLTITLDNSFNGLYKKEDDIFISSKRNEPGIGINSIKNVVKKYNGGYKFETKKHTFMASIYLKINN